MNLPSEPLTGRFVRLEPFVPALKAELAQALNVDPDSWSILSTSAFGDRFEPWWDAALAEAAAGRRIPFAVRSLASGALVGTTSWLKIRAAHRGVEIGATFYRPEARGGVVNPECKLLLLGAAFAAGAVRVELVADARNTRSAAAIVKLGAKPEGVLRRHKITWTGYVRDTAVFSITDEEWPVVRAGLEARLAQFTVSA
jgi:RimJ/RimL family protein N-acetyltransferase